MVRQSSAKASTAVRIRSGPRMKDYQIGDPFLFQEKIQDECTSETVEMVGLIGKKYFKMKILKKKSVCLI